MKIITIIRIVNNNNIALLTCNLYAPVISDTRHTKHTTID